MSDDKRYDEWTQGPEVPPGQRHRVSDRPVAEGEDADALRERQRLQQLEMMDRWMSGVLTEQRRSRRWKLFFRLFFAALILASLSLTVYGLFFVADKPAPAGPLLGVVRVEGVIDAQGEASAERVIEGL